jgi:predicted RNA-binding Zn ribbon-like protein
MSTPTQWTDDHFIAGDIALDFANTVYRRTPEVGPDLLESSEDLAGWFVHAGLLSTGAPAGSESMLAQAKILRGLLLVLLDAQCDGHDVPTEALAGLMDLARKGLREDVSVAANGVVTPRSVEGALATVALHGLKLALSPPHRPVRTCDRCGWFFLDVSRGRRRRWCSMKTCGNQTKAARYRATHP